MVFEVFGSTMLDTSKVVLPETEDTFLNSIFKFQKVKKEKEKRMVRIIFLHF